MKAYRNLLGRMVSGLLLAGAFVVLSAARADAALIVYICNDAACAAGGTFVDQMITDNGAGDTNTTLGRISAQVAGGTVIELASSYPSVGTAATPTLKLSYDLDLVGFAALDFTPYFFATQDGFTTTGLAGVEADASSGGGTASLYTGAGVFAPGPGNFSLVSPGAAVASCVLDCNTAAATFATAPYYLAIQVAPTPDAAGASGDVTVTVPDGGSTAMLLGSMLFAFGAFRRKFNGR